MINTRSKINPSQQQQQQQRPPPPLPLQPQPQTTAAQGKKKHNPGHNNLPLPPLLNLQPPTTEKKKKKKKKTHNPATTDLPLPPLNHNHKHSTVTVTHLSPKSSRSSAHNLNPNQNPISAAIHDPAATHNLNPNHLNQPIEATTHNFNPTHRSYLTHHPQPQPKLKPNHKLKTHQINQNRTKSQPRSMIHR